MKKLSFLPLSVFVLLVVACVTTEKPSPFIQALAKGLQKEKGITAFHHGVFANGGVEWFAFSDEGKTWVMANGHPPEPAVNELWLIVDQEVPEDEHLVIKTYWLGLERVWIEDEKAGFYRYSIVEGKGEQAIEILERASRK